MTSDTNSEIDTYYSLKPNLYRFVESLSLRQVLTPLGEDYDAVLDLQLRHFNGNTHPKLLLQFTGVKNLRLTPPERTIIQMALIEITSIHEYGWEGINYRVEETDDNSLSFLCCGFTAWVEHSPNM